MSTRPVVFPDVLVLHHNDMGWLCQFEGRPVFVVRLQVEPGTTMPADGERGPVTIAAVAVGDVRAAIQRAWPRP